MNPTLRQIAAACGVNVSTVSRALANRRRVGEATRRRILAEARRMGWKPNPLAAAYMTHLRATGKPRPEAAIAFVLAFRHIGRFADLPGYHADVFAGARDRAESLGYALEPVWLHDVDFDVRRLSRMLKSRGMLGVLLHGGDIPGDFFMALEWDAFAAAAWALGVRQPVLHRASHNEAHGIRLIMRRIHEFGYARVALVLSQAVDEVTDHAILSSFCFEQRNRASAPLVNICSSAGEASRATIQGWLRRRRPEVVIGDMSAWEAIRAMGWRVPEDVAFVSPSWHASWPGTAGVDHRQQEIGANAVDLVAGQITRNERGVPAVPKLVLTEGIWRDGPSLPPACARRGRQEGGGAQQ
jgi:LacI family transcriptional regulator